MRDRCRVYMDFLQVNEACFMVIWTIFKNHLLEEGLTSKSGDHDTLKLSQPLICYMLSCVRTPHEQEVIERAFGRGHGHVTTLEGP